MKTYERNTHVTKKGSSPRDISNRSRNSVESDTKRGFSTRTSAVLEELVFDRNILDLNQSKFKELQDMRTGYITQFSETNAKYSGNPSQQKDKQISIIDCYKTDLTKLLKNESYSMKK